MKPPIAIVNVSCNCCGAPLEISQSTQFVRCSHCGASLKVIQTDSSRFTEEVEGISRRLDVISAQNEIERLDREFQLASADMMVTGKDGSKSKPSTVAGVITIVGGVIFGVFWTVGAASMGAPGLFALFGLVFIGIAVVMGISMISAASHMSDLEGDYRLRRRRLLSELAQAKETKGSEK